LGHGQPNVYFSKYGDGMVVLTELDWEVMYMLDMVADE